MKLIKSFKHGYIIGFDGDSPIFGDKSFAMKFDVCEAIDLCFELDSEDDSYSTTNATK